MENELLNELAARGCAIATNLSEVYLGNETFYVRMLTKLSATACPARMEAALAAGDAEAFFSAAHELKGLYGALGLTPLLDVCAPLVEVARAGSLEGVAEALPAVLAEHRAYCALIDAL